MRYQEINPRRSNDRMVAAMGTVGSGDEKMIMIFFLLESINRLTVFTNMEACGYGNDEIADHILLIYPLVED